MISQTYGDAELATLIGRKLDSLAPMHQLFPTILYAHQPTHPPVYSSYHLGIHIHPSIELCNVSIRSSINPAVSTSIKSSTQSSAKCTDLSLYVCLSLSLHLSPSFSHQVDRRCWILATRN